MKNKMIYVLLVFSLVFLSVNLVQAGPMPWGIALNHGTSECAGYWAGDEFTYYELPYGWKAYYPDYKSYNDTTDLIIIETDIGNFNITKSEFPFGDWYLKFCNETGYSYVSQNIGIKQNLTGFSMQKFLMDNILFFVSAIGFILVIIFILYKIKMKKKED